MTQTNEERQKILDKVAKLKRLSASSEAHEAAAALRQMSKMMEIHQITEAEMDGIEIKNAQASFKERLANTVPVHYNVMASMISRALGVKAVFTPREKNETKRLGHVRLSVRYFGLPGRPEMAVHAHNLMLKSMQKAWKEKLEKDVFFAAMHETGEFGKNARQSFYLGWLAEVQGQLSAYGFQDGEEAAIEGGKLAYYGRELEDAKTRNQGFSRSASTAGSEAAKEFSLHRPMNGNPLKALTNG